MMKNILFVGSEFYPFVKTGGLGDAISSLFRAVQISGNQATILLPGYRAITDKITRLHEVHEILIPFSVAIRARLKKVSLVGQTTPIWILDVRQFFHQPGGIYDEVDGTEGHLNTLRFAMLSWAASELACGKITAWRADIVHCHDWHAALVPVFIKKKFTGDLENSLRPRSLLTIHNLAFQGHCQREYLGILGLDDFMPPDTRDNSISLLSLGIRHADEISTVSPTYAKEILGREFGCGLEDLLGQRGVRGILNGVDYNVWHPQSDAALDISGFRFDGDARRSIKAGLQAETGLKCDGATPLLSITNRLTHQKMADIVLDIVPCLMKMGVQIIAMGEGQAEYVERFCEASDLYRGKFGYIEKFSEVMEHRIHAGADICLSPSRFEPCGLNPLYAMCYGSVPVVRATGGLCDTVVDATLQAIHSGSANGILFENADASALLASIERALALFRDRPLWVKLQANAMRSSFLWQQAAREYCEIYDALMPATPRAKPQKDPKVLEMAHKEVAPPSEFVQLLYAPGSG